MSDLDMLTPDSTGFIPNPALVLQAYRHAGNGAVYTIRRFIWNATDDLWMVHYTKEGSTVEFVRTVADFFGQRAGPRFTRVPPVPKAAERRYAGSGAMRETYPNAMPNEVKVSHEPAETKDALSVATEKALTEALLGKYPKGSMLKVQFPTPQGFDADGGPLARD